MRKTAPFLLIFATLFIYMKEKGIFETKLGFSETNEVEEIEVENTHDEIAAAFKAGRGDFMVRGKAKVTNILPDDTKGSRHQRFLIKLENDHTLLVAHNIDLAPRVENIKEGDEIVFFGEYDWNDKGGVIHWTHKDPNNKHEHGWIKHKGIVYE